MTTTTAGELPIRRMPAPAAGKREALISREWLVTNGRGGYASGTVAGVATRRCDGHLVAALPPRRRFAC